MTSRRTIGCLLAGLLGVAGCSSSAPTEISGPPPVTGNGRHYSYAAGSEPASSWPAVCPLLTTWSAADAIGTAVTTKTFHHRCFYVPGNDSFPTLTLTILGIGSAQRSHYDQVRADNARFHPTAVAGVGDAAVTYDLAGSPTVNLDVLAAQGLFEIALRSPVGNVLGAADARATLVRVGRALAGEFGG